MDLQGTSAVVTGGSSGIGAACAARLSAAGAAVVVADLQQPSASGPLPAGARFARTDVTDTDQMVAAVDLASSLGPLRSVVAAAGMAWLTRTIGRDGDYGTAHDLDAFRRVLEVNTVGAFNTVRLAASAMSRNDPDPTGARGAIAVIASAAAFNGQRGQAAYAASKAALVGMTVPVARDLAGVGIRVNTLSPGVVDTPIYGNGPAAKAFQEEQVATSVLFPKRPGRPDEIAGAVLELLSNDYLNAYDLRVDGGLRLRPEMSAGWRGVGR